MRVYMRPGQDGGLQSLRNGIALSNRTPSFCYENKNTMM